jgi:hypothetical protein
MRSVRSAYDGFLVHKELKFAVMEAFSGANRQLPRYSASRIVLGPFSLRSDVFWCGVTLRWWLTYSVCIKLVTEATVYNPEGFNWGHRPAVQSLPSKTKTTR